MGDRVLIQIVSTDRKEFSPVAYGHWCGDHTPEIVARLKARMLPGRPGDVAYTFARVIQEMTAGDTGALSFGAWNEPAILTAADSHGDAGVVLIDATTFRCKCLGGYLIAGRDGLPKRRA